MKIFGVHDENTLRQLERVAQRAERVALMADGHFGYVMPVGGVAAYDGQVSVSGVGFDIACGNAAIRTDLDFRSIEPHLQQIADEIQAEISFGVGGLNTRRDAPVDHPLFESPAWEAIPGYGPLRDKARGQLGTVGSGNHYVDVFEDAEGKLWVGVHFGSRGFGHTVASGFLSLAAGAPWGRRVPETEALLDLGTPMGDAYWSAMELAGEYAYAGREWVARLVVEEILGAREVELVHNHHNFAWKETHEGRELVVVRKGATPAYPGQKGFIGGSMGDDAVIVRGAASGAAATGAAADSSPGSLMRAALFSTVHGAGRVMSRTQAKGKRHRKTGRVLREGQVTPAMMQEWLRRKNVVLRGGDLDEAPHAYRRLTDVLASQGETIEVLEVLRPVIVVMAGPGEFDL